MNIISHYKLLLILITQAIHFSEHMKHKKESSSIDICKGNDVDLLWKVDEEENRISKLEWYFYNKTICTSSPLEDFTVNIPYQGRLERIGKTEIRLKNVSIDDEGIYILFPLLAWSTSQNMQKIVLRVLEPPTNKCTCKLGHPSDFKGEQTASYCGRPQVSLVWKRKQTLEVLGEGNYILINSSLQDNEILCCQAGEAMKCVDDPRQFCTSVSIPHRDDQRPSEDGNTQHTDSLTIPVFGDRDTGSTNFHYIKPFVLVTSTVSTLAAIFVLVAIIIICRKRRNIKDVAAEREKKGQRLDAKKINTSTSEQIEENVPMMEINRKQHEAVEPAIKPVLEGPLLWKNSDSQVRQLGDGDLPSSTGETESPNLPSNDLNTVKEFQKWSRASLYPVLETEEAIAVHQPTNSSETKIEVQELQLATLYPALEKAEALSEHQPSLYLETIEEMQELHQAALCKICFANNMNVVLMPCNHIVTCAHCSIALQQCPVCRVLIKMKMIICFN